jgi:hypothetical protein
MFLGMRGTGDWVDGQRPKNWRQQILKLYPNGSAPLTAMLSMMGSTRVNDPEYNWWTQAMTSVNGDVDGIFTNVNMTTAYTSGGAVGDVIYVYTTDSDVFKRVRKGHQILLRDASDYSVDVNGKVIEVYRGTGYELYAVKLLEADDNSSTHDLSDADVFKIIGNINPEGGEMPDAIALNPVKVYNYTQIFRTPLSITRTARATHLRTGDQYQKMKAEALEMHSWEMELAFWFGIRTESVGDNGKPERTTMGALNFIRQFAAANCNDYTLNTDFSGDAWTAGGETWLKAYLEQIFRYGADQKVAFAGSGALLGIDALASNSGTIQVLPGAKTYGMEIREWVTPFGSIYIKTHPLFSYDATTRNMMAIVEPKELGYRYITDTTFYGESKSKDHPEGYGQRRVDGTDEEYLTECGLEFGLPQKCAILNGVGLDNGLT